MDLKRLGVFLLIVTAVLALFVVSPALQRLVVPPQTEFFSELWLLGPQHTTENYPFNISRNENYSVFLGIGNHLGNHAYYLVEVKFSNQTQSTTSSNHTSSSLPSLYNITAFVPDKGIWESAIVFSFEYTFSKSLSQVSFSQMTLNDTAIDLTPSTAGWNPQENAYSGNLLFELWMYNNTIGNFQYNECSVSLRFNMTSES